MVCARRLLAAASILFKQKQPIDSIVYKNGYGVMLTRGIMMHELTMNKRTACKISSGRKKAREIQPELLNMQVFEHAIPELTFRIAGLRDGCTQDH
jgi:hypothetical protein